MTTNLFTQDLNPRMHITALYLGACKTELYSLKIMIMTEVMITDFIYLNVYFHPGPGR